MKKILHPLVLIPLTALGTASLLILPDAIARQDVTTTQALPERAAAPELVSGLPDFTRLVEQVGNGVVSVEVKMAPRQSQATGFAGDDPMLEIFRRFGMPLPGIGSQTPRGGDARPRNSASGTGFIISADGYVLTNHHVVEGADEITLRLNDRRELKARLIGSDAQTDVALLKVEATGLPALRLGQSAAVKPGQWAVAIGSPYGLEHTVTAGIVSAVGRATGGQQYVPFIQTDVAINRGNSGGPLLNTRGEVVGINSQIFSVSGGFQGISFAIPIDVAMNAAEQIKTTGQVRRGMLGVNMQPLTSELARSLGLPDARGALVSDVEPDSAAARAGLQAGDVVRRFNDVVINETSELPPMVGALPPGSKVRLGVWRDGRERQIEATLGEAPSNALAGNAEAGEGRGNAATSGTSAGKLGLRIAELDAEDRRQLGLKSGEGVGIVGVESQSAREAGLARGDVILAVGRTPVGSAAALQSALASVRAGDSVMLRLAAIPGRSPVRFVALQVEK